ncbi:MAG: Beta-galactosidase C-terminal domain [Bacteroidota bacterium]|nr:Beta-galactosidase C-terminal domain [Bacteroidota bacterium]
MRYIFNYSAKPCTVNYPFGNGRELLLDKTVTKNSALELEPWGVKIIEEQ